MKPEKLKNYLTADVLSTQRRKCQKYVSFGQNVFTFNFRKDSKSRGLKDYSLLQTEREKEKLLKKRRRERNKNVQENYEQIHGSAKYLSSSPMFVVR